jgi:hypothetical protein
LLVLSGHRILPPRGKVLQKLHFDIQKGPLTRGPFFFARNAVGRVQIIRDFQDGDRESCR